MKPTWQSHDLKNLAELVADDELTVILTDPAGGDVPEWVGALKAKSIPSQTKTYHYLTLYSGSLAANGAKPFLLALWENQDRPSLERRWVGGQIAKRMDTVFTSAKIAVVLPGQPTAESVALAEDLFLGQTTPLYQQSRHESFRIITDRSAARESVDPHGDVRFRFQLQYRQWVNENPDELTSLAIGERLAQFAKQHGVTFTELDTAALEKEGMNLLLAVGQASTRSPSRLFFLTHRVTPGSRPLLLVGKGITFDTGGINVKPFEGFVNCMKNDMGGAGLMANLFMALVASGYDQPLALAIPACENLVGEQAMKPGAVVKSRSGKTVFIEHTDAEGRLILADALDYAYSHVTPAVTMVAATLTTAALRQFSNFFTPVHFPNQRLEEAITAGARQWGEGFTFWQDFLPFRVANRSKAADLTNMGRMPSNANIGGGSNVAAHFLREFAKGPFVHFDIFNSVWNWGGDYPGAHYGATGAPFNSLFHALRASDGDLWGYGAG